MWTRLRHLVAVCGERWVWRQAAGLRGDEDDRLRMREGLQLGHFHSLSWSHRHRRSYRAEWLQPMPVQLMCPQLLPPVQECHSLQLRCTPVVPP